MEFGGQRVTVVGLAREGTDLTRFLVGQGADVLVNDARPREELGAWIEALGDLPVRYALGGHPLSPTLDADVLVVSPGVPPTISLLVEARRRGLPVTSATRLFFERCRAPIVGITGSSGKTTTTTLTGRIFEAAGRRTFVGGNIGVPLLGQVDEIGPDDWVVLELSSFQLETMDVSPHVAAVTNITPNHLDRHESMAAYTAAKATILNFQVPSDWAVLNADDGGSSGLTTAARVLRFSLEGAVEGAYLEGDSLVLARDGRREVICRTGELRLLGRHNVANVLTACAIASAAGIDVTAMRAAVLPFTGVRHRLESVGEVAGVRYLNDSIATSPERSMAALAAFGGRPLVLLAGGRDKHLPMEEWGQRIAATVHDLIVFGEMARLVERSAREAGMPAERIHAAGTVQRAVKIAHDVARPGDVVLLSPGGTSYDQYHDFEERGADFAAAVDAVREGEEA
ncbi:MAG: UDP-N-acetylmuramoyl-L-alanine--D-glutamate ligase [Chloroflexi bacterium]|nr:UDP-N-acetylmuramoyl-L-alanine--D-glutamate ligase [Chloroflexota bacterium]